MRDSDQPLAALNKFVAPSEALHNRFTAQVPLRFWQVLEFLLPLRILNPSSLSSGFVLRKSVEIIIQKNI